MKNWVVELEQKKRTGKVSERTERRNKKAEKETKKTNKNTLENAIKYLLSDKHNNHYYTNIIDLGNARLVRDRIFEQYEEMKEKHGKGLSNIASSFVLSLPADLYHPTKEEWEDIYHETINKFVKAINDDLEKKQTDLESVDVDKLSKRQKKEYELNKERYSQRLDIDDVKKLSTAVIHDDREKPLIVGETSGSHLNIIMSNIIGGEVIKYISQKGGLVAMKNAYSQTVKERLGLDCELYIPYNSRPDDNKLKDFYLGEPKVDILVLDENTPHKNKIVEVKKNEKDKNIPLWVDRLNKKERIQKEYNDVEDAKKKVMIVKNAILEERNDLREERREIDINKADIENGEKKLNSSKTKFLEFQNDFIDYLDVIKNKLDDDYLYTYTNPETQKTQFFDNKLEADTFAKVNNVEVEKPYILQLKEYLSIKFEEIFSGFGEKITEILDKYNNLIENESEKLEIKNKVKSPRNKM